jgi:hypothetical protein
LKVIPGKVSGVPLLRGTRLPVHQGHSELSRGVSGFFDEDVPPKLAQSLPQYEVHTVVCMHWGGIKTGALLALIEREGFNVFLIGDKHMLSQQRLDDRSDRVFKEISAALDDARPGTVRTIDCGVFIPRLKRPSE